MSFSQYEVLKMEDVSDGVEAYLGLSRMGYINGKGALMSGGKEPIQLSGIGYLKFDKDCIEQSLILKNL